MLRLRKSHFCGISVIFFQCCFMCETQILMTFSNFGGFFFLESFPGRGFYCSMEGGSFLSAGALLGGRFSGNHFLKGGFTFQWRGGSFLSGRVPHSWGISFDGGEGFKKNHRMGGIGRKNRPWLVGGLHPKSPSEWTTSSTTLFGVYVKNTLFAYVHSFSQKCKNLLFQPLLFADCRWMVRKGVDVECCIVSLSKREVFLCCTVECNI